MSLPVEDPRLCARMLHAAIDSGINLIDTADLYDRGLNEEIVGLSLEGRRDKVVLATKVGNRWRPDGKSWDWDPSPAYLRKSIDENLRRLKTDFIDLYQLHGGTMEDPIDDVIGVFEELKAVGKIRHYGISSIRPNVIRRWVGRSHLASVMTQYSLADRRPEEETLRLLSGSRVTILARGVLAKGLLCGKPPVSHLGHSMQAIAGAASAVKKCSGEGRTPVQTAIRYVLASEGVCTVVGASTLGQLMEVAYTPATPELSEDELRLLSESIPALRYEEHR